MMARRNGGEATLVLLLYTISHIFSSEGIQVGNVGCAAGVVGVWTTVLHDRGQRP